ncbi:MAG: hypothetical protein IPM95_12940 [Sphingobacteriales bacterium]|nr:hypothetical protein [Sphingobacteriales bacterium]
MISVFIRAVFSIDGNGHQRYDIVREGFANLYKDNVLWLNNGTTLFWVVRDTSVVIYNIDSTGSIIWSDTLNYKLVYTNVTDEKVINVTAVH